MLGTIAVSGGDTGASALGDLHISTGDVPYRARLTQSRWRSTIVLIGDSSVRWRKRGCHPSLTHLTALDNERREFDSLNRFLEMTNMRRSECTPLPKWCPAPIESAQSLLSRNRDLGFERTCGSGARLPTHGSSRDGIDARTERSSGQTVWGRPLFPAHARSAMLMRRRSARQRSRPTACMLLGQHEDR